MLVRREKQTVAIRREKQRRHKLRRCQRSLWYLLVEVLGYGWNGKAGRWGKGLTERFHRPICDWYDQYESEMALFLMCQRGQHKTTIAIGLVIQAWLRNPLMTVLYFHAVLKEATDVLLEVANHCRRNKALRELDPVGTWPNDPEQYQDLAGRPYRIFPHTNRKKWETAQEIRFDRHDFSRHANLFATSAGSEVTGRHGKMAIADDIIGRNDIEDNQLPKKADWWQNTVIPVTDDHTFRAFGTPWSDWGIYQDWLASSDWRTLSIPGSINDEEDLTSIDWSAKHITLEPCYDISKGTPTYGMIDSANQLERQRKRLRFLKRQMKSNFGPQVMIDPSPKGSKPWNKDTCEHRISLQDAKGPGCIWVLSDPAPMLVGATRDEDKQKARGDGTKDPWSIAVIKLRRNGERVQGILLDGAKSRHWITDKGMDTACEMMRRWKTGYCIHEAYGGLVERYDREMASATQRAGLYWMRYDHKGNPIQFRNSYVKGAKNVRFADLAAWAAQGDFFICESVPEDYLGARWDDQTEQYEIIEGNRHDGFLAQAREWAPLDSGRNSLSYDDDADVVARSTDTVLLDFIPMVDDAWGLNPLDEEEDYEDYPRRSLYCAV